jgi:hypothetical protein
VRFAIDPAGDRVWATSSEVSRVESIDGVAGLLLGPVLGGLLRLRGSVSLHGCVVDVGASAAVLLGRRGAGKSTLAATMAQGGHAVLSDDIAALDERAPSRWVAHPGYPRLRVHPSTIGALRPPVPDGGRVFRSLDKHYLELSTERRARAWRFQPQPLPVAAVYVLERDSDCSSPVIEEVTGAARLAALVRHSRSALAPLDPHTRARELTRLGGLAAAVPIRRVRCPEGLETVPAVCEAIVAGVHSTPSPD